MRSPVPPWWRWSPSRHWRRSRDGPYICDTRTTALACATRSRSCAWRWPSRSSRLSSRARPLLGVLAVAVVALGLDGIDGWLARRQGYVSEFGARFDMEVDSVLALVLAVSAAVAGGLGPAAILLGVPRYAFALALWACPGCAATCQSGSAAKLVCVVQLSALIALQLPILPTGLADGDGDGGWPGACLVLRCRRGLAVAAPGMTQHKAADGAGQIGRNAIQLGLAALLLHLVLIQPNHPAAMTFGALVRPAAWNCRSFFWPWWRCRPGRGHRLARVLIVVALVVIAVLKAADYAMFMALGRGFNPVADLPLIRSAVHLAAGAIGPVLTGAAVLAALIALALVAAALWWATGVWARLERRARTARVAAAGGGSVRRRRGCRDRPCHGPMEPAAGAARGCLYRPGRASNAYRHGARDAGRSACLRAAAAKTPMRDATPAWPRSTGMC
jgi:phosphatidylglycerophosphate synthase